jgi:hypothetical protein
MASPMNDLREELRRAASTPGAGPKQTSRTPCVIGTNRCRVRWSASSRQPRAPSAALGDGWRIVEMFGYGADDVTETAHFGVVTRIGLGMFGEILLVEGKGFY